MSYPAKYNFDVSQNETVTRVFTWQTGTPASPVNLTGYTAKMQVKWAATDSTALITLTDGSGITLGGSAGTISVNIPYATMQTIPAGIAVYDLELLSGAGGTMTPLIAGNFTIRQEVTV
jgi:hypothetical protein